MLLLSTQSPRFKLCSPHRHIRTSTDRLIQIPKAGMRRLQTWHVLFFRTRIRVSERYGSQFKHTLTCHCAQTYGSRGTIGRKRVSRRPNCHWNDATLSWWNIVCDVCKTVFAIVCATPSSAHRYLVVRFFLGLYAWISRSPERNVS
jgi:hypothetical protein